MGGSVFVVERILHWNSKRLLVLIAAPERRQEPDQGWQCRYEIRVEDDPEGSSKGEIVGSDPLQALELAIDAAGYETAKRFPEAYFMSPTVGPAFSFRIGQSLPEPYHQRLVQHLRREYEKKYEELVDEIIRSRREGRN